jgi:hypothetical protein
LIHCRQCGETLGKQDPVEGFPTDGIEGLPKIQIENCGGDQPLVARLDNVRSIDKVFGDGVPRDEPSLIGVNKKGEEGTEPKGEAFGVEFEAAILKRYRSEIFGLIGPHFFRKEDNKGLIDRPEVGFKGVEVMERF